MSIRIAPGWSPPPVPLPSLTSHWPLTPQEPHRSIDIQGRLRTIVRVDTHYHIWYYRRDSERTIRSMERDDTVYTTRRKATYTLSDGRQYWKAGQVLQCVDGAFCKPMPEEIVDRGVPFGPK